MGEKPRSSALAPKQRGAKTDDRRPPDQRTRDRSGRDTPHGMVWIYGAHAALAALANPRRRIQRVLLSPEARQRHGAEIAANALRNRPEPETAPRAQIDQILSDSGSTLAAVHQGLAVLAAPLDQPDLSEVLQLADSDTGHSRARPVILVLDQVTDPHNVGAILRSAAAFGARAVITPARHAAPETGVLAKAASGALEVVPYIAVTNLARALAQMKGVGYWSLGLAGEAERNLADADPGGPLALVLGAEGAGLRRLTRESCDILARLPTQPPIDSLNVSNAAAVALYALASKAPPR